MESRTYSLHPTAHTHPPSIQTVIALSRTLVKEPHHIDRLDLIFTTYIYIYICMVCIHAHVTCGCFAENCIGCHVMLSAYMHRDTVHHRHTRHARHTYIWIVLKLHRYIHHIKMHMMIAFWFVKMLPKSALETSHWAWGGVILVKACLVNPLTVGAIVQLEERLQLLSYALAYPWKAGKAFNNNSQRQQGKLPIQPGVSTWSEPKSGLDYDDTSSFTDQCLCVFQACTRK